MQRNLTKRINGLLEFAVGTVMFPQDEPKMLGKRENDSEWSARCLEVYK